MLVLFSPLKRPTVNILNPSNLSLNPIFLVDSSKINSLFIILKITLVLFLNVGNILIKLFLASFETTKILSKYLYKHLGKYL